ncbi:MAG: hypothetical protein E7172_03905 [Firmicutes bacterium]|nr:hypothetical protein [Bacillota bacterium]
MQIEIVIIAVIVFTIMTVGGQININQMISDNQVLFMKLKESDWDFYVRAKYGNQMNPDILYNKRIKNALMVMVLVFMFMIKGMNAVKILIIFVIGYLVFKQPYNDLKNYYKKHIHIIDSMLPYYLKSLEILIQHYTVPVAIGKSMADAPEIFREGLRNMIDSINAGDDSIEPYMQFAREYPVRDSMRMMRLLYRLSLGRQERKQEQILTFSRTISNLQQKARETRYKNRLEKMEGKTMSMLITTGVGVMILLVLAVVQLMGM